MNQKTPTKYDLEIDVTPQKNTLGTLGEICDVCAGYGYTLVLGGESQSAGCHTCNQTGIKAVDTRALQIRVIGLEKQIQSLAAIITKFAEENNI